MMVSTIQQCESAIGIHMSPPTSIIWIMIQEWHHGVGVPTHDLCVVSGSYLSQRTFLTCGDMSYGAAFIKLYSDTDSKTLHLRPGRLHKGLPISGMSNAWCVSSQIKNTVSLKPGQVNKDSMNEWSHNSFRRPVNQWLSLIFQFSQLYNYI